MPYMWPCSGQCSCSGVQVIAWEKEWRQWAVHLLPLLLGQCHSHHTQAMLW